MEQRVGSGNQLTSVAQCSPAKHTFTDIVERIRVVRDNVRLAQNSTDTLLCEYVNKQGCDDVCEKSPLEPKPASVVVSIIEEESRLVSQLFQLDTDICHINYKLFGITRDVINADSPDENLEGNHLSYQMGFLMARIEELLWSINEQLDVLSARVCGMVGNSPESFPLVENLIDEKFGQLDLVDSLTNTMIEKLDMLIGRV